MKRGSAGLVAPHGGARLKPLALAGEALAAVAILRAYYAAKTP